MMAPPKSASGYHFLIEQGYFCHFHKVSFEIKILYGRVGRGYGGGGRIRLQNRLVR